MDNRNVIAWKSTETLEGKIIATSYLNKDFEPIVSASNHIFTNRVYDGDIVKKYSSYHPDIICTEIVDKNVTVKERLTKSKRTTTTITNNLRDDRIITETEYEYINGYMFSDSIVRSREVRNKSNELISAETDFYDGSYTVEKYYKGEVASSITTLPNKENKIIVSSTMVNGDTIITNCTANTKIVISNRIDPSLVLDINTEFIPEVTDSIDTVKFVFENDKLTNLTTYIGDNIADRLKYNPETNECYEWFAYKYEDFKTTIIDKIMGTETIFTLDKFKNITMRTENGETKLESIYDYDNNLRIVLHYQRDRIVKCVERLELDEDGKMAYPRKISNLLYRGYYRHSLDIQDDVLRGFTYPDTDNIADGYSVEASYYVKYDDNGRMIERFSEAGKVVIQYEQILSY